MPALSFWEERDQRLLSICLNEKKVRDYNASFSLVEEKRFAFLQHLHDHELPKLDIPASATERRSTAASQTKSKVLASKTTAKSLLLCITDKPASTDVFTEPAEKRSGILRRARSRSADLETRRPKAVFFSDAMGLPLVQVRSFSEGLERVAQAGWCGEGLSFSQTVQLPLRFIGDQPCACADFLTRLRQQRVCLESLRMDGERALGCVQVTNIHFEKVVSVRITTDGWRTFSDVAADYEGSLGPEIDRFSFLLVLHLRSSSVRAVKTMFAIRYLVGGKEFWDNNYGSNYRIDQ